MKTIIKNFFLFLVLATLTSLDVKADIPCAEIICVGSPYTSATNVINDTYYNGSFYTHTDVQVPYALKYNLYHRRKYVATDDWFGWYWYPVQETDYYGEDLIGSAAQVRLLGNERLIAVWQENAGARTYNYYSVLFNTDGSVHQGKTLIASTTNGSGEYTLEKLGIDQYVLVWGEFDAAIYGIHFNDNNVQTRIKYKINFFAADCPNHGELYADDNLMSFTTASIGSANNFMLVYATCNGTIYGKILSPQGGLIKQDFIISTELNAEGGGQELHIAKLKGINEGGIAIAWQSISANPNSVKSLMLDANGQRIGAVHVLSRNTSGLSFDGGAAYHSPKVIGLDSGGYVLASVATDYNSTNTYFGHPRNSIVYRRMSAAGQIVDALPVYIWREMLMPNQDLNENIDIDMAQPFYSEGMIGFNLIDEGSDVFTLHWKSITSIDVNSYQPNYGSFSVTKYGTNSFVTINADGSSSNIQRHILRSDLNRISCRSFEYCDNKGVYYDYIEKKSNGDYIGRIRNYGYFDGAWVTKSRLQPISTIKRAEIYVPARTEDLALQVKVIDGDSPRNEYLSPIKYLLYADPNQGANGSVSYANGYTNALSTLVTIDMPCTSCDALQLYQRTAPLVAGACGVYGGWTVTGSRNAPTQLSHSVAVSDALCYQFKANATNSALGINHEYLSTGVLQVDQSAPDIAIQSSSLSFDTLTLDLTATDAASTVIAQSYDLNSSGVSTNIIASPIVITVQEGLNRVQLSATDAAGNTRYFDHFVTANLTPPQIRIVGIEDGGTYADDLALVYHATQELTNVTITVDGVARSDLTGLVDGPHTLVITGAYGTQTITQSVNFTINRNLFSFQLLSPQQDRTYGYNDIPIQYQASKPLRSLSYQLNGAPARSDLTLQELANGSHQLVLTAVSETGETEMRTINFSVQQALPSLTVQSPTDGTVYPALTVPLQISAADANVTLSLDGNLISDTGSLIFEEDGQHQLTITATHPISGSVVSESIQFFTDSVAPVVQVLSPEPRIYTQAKIPINYTSNKALQNVQFTLDGAVVTSLSSLTAGNHQFRMTATDLAGRVVDIPVNFEVARLAFVAPRPNEQLISNEDPPTVAVEYQSEGNFEQYTLAVDDQAPNLLVPSEGPGSVIPVSVSAGNHDLTLKGQIRTQQVGTRVNFRIGAKNVAVGPGSIDYNYINCDSNFNDCTVLVSLTVTNRGDYDINESIAVRFDHIRNNGARSYWVTIPLLASKAKSTQSLLPFTASLGDTFTVNVDPHAELVGEWAQDNRYSIDFSAGQITDVETALDPRNIYFDGVSVFNLVAVMTAGPVAKVQYRVNGWTFENSDKASHFSSLIDMGLLDKNNLCVEIRALSDVGITLDATVRCFLVSSLNIAGLTKSAYTWELHQATPRVVVLDTVDNAQMLQQLAFLRKQLLLSSAAIYPVIKDNGKVDYKFHYDPAAITNRLEQTRARWSNDGFLNGNVGLPNGQSLFVSTIDPTRGACTVEGAIPINIRDREQLLQDIYAAELKEINELGALFPNMSLTQLNLLTFFNVFGAPLYHSETLLSAEELLFSGIFEDQLAEERQDSLFVDILLGFFDLKFITVGWVSGHIPPRLVEVTAVGSLVQRFVGDHCILVDRANLDFELRMEGYYDYGLRDGAFNVSVNDLRLDVTAYSYLSWGIPGTDLSLHYPMFFSDAKFRVYGLDTTIPVDYGVRHGIKITDNNLQEFGPFHARFGVSMYVDHQLGRAEIETYPLFIPTLVGVGYGYDYKVYLRMIADAKFDLIAGRGFPDQFNHYVNYDFSAKVYRRKKYCILGRCHHRSWKLDEVLFKRPYPDENIPFGVPYTSQQVRNDLNRIGAPW